MKHPVRVFAILFLVLSAVATAIVMIIRYMDVLQDQFDFLRSLLMRRNNGISDIHDGEYDDEFDEEDECSCCIHESCDDE